MNDGVTVAKEVELEDPVENIGAKLVRQVCTHTQALLTHILGAASLLRTVSWLWDDCHPSCVECLDAVPHLLDALRHAGSEPWQPVFPILLRNMVYCHSLLVKLSLSLL